MFVRLYHSWLNSYLGIPRTVWFLAFVNLVNRCGGLVIGFIALYMTQHLHLGIEQAGYAMSCFGVGTLMGAYSGGRLTDRLGYFNVMLYAMMANGLVLLSILLVHHFYTVCAAVFVLGFVSEAFRPANSVSVMRNSTHETYTRSISLYRMSANIGWAVAPVLAGTLVVFGWHWLFWVDGLTCILAAGLLMYYKPFLNLEKPVRNEAASSGQTPEQAESSPLQDKAFRWFLVFTLLNAVVFMQFLWTVPVFYKEFYHWSEQQIGIMVALNGVIVFLVEMPLIFRIEGRRPNLEMVRIGVILYALGYASLLIPHFPWVAATCYIFMLSIGEIYVMPFSSNFTMKRSGVYNQGQYMAAYIMTYSFANTLAPLVGTQLIARFGFSTLWGIMVLFAGASFAGFRILSKKSEA